MTDAGPTPPITPLDEALLDLVGEARTFLLETANGGRTEHLGKNLEFIHVTALALQEALDGHDTYRGWLETMPAASPPG